MRDERGVGERKEAKVDEWKGSAAAKLVLKKYYTVR